MNPGGPYRLSNSQLILERFRLLSDVAASNRRLDRFLELVAAMEQRVSDLAKGTGATHVPVSKPRAGRVPRASK